MKTGIIGLPQVGKTSLFRILTKAHLSPAHANPREAHVGVAKVPDDRLDRLAALYHPEKLTHASVEYVDVGAIGQEALKESSYIGHLRNVDALAHVVRAFEDESIPHAGPIEPLRDIKNVEFELMKRGKAQIEAERPLREMEMTPEDKKRFRGFMFLSEKPILYVLNIGESTELGKDLEAAVTKYGLTDLISGHGGEDAHGVKDAHLGTGALARPVEQRSTKNVGATAICGKVEAELAEMSDADAAEFLSSYGLTESGLARLIRKTYALLGLISFFTAGEDECRAWTIPVNTRAVQAAGAIHSDLEHHFIRAETIRWDQLLEAGSEANARARGTLRLEGKDYIVQDGDVMHIRHSG